MTDVALAKKHFGKALRYHFDGNRRAMKEARTAIEYCPAWAYAALAAGADLFACRAD